MSLSHEEQLRLDEMGSHIRTTDPEFFSRMAATTVERRWRRFVECVALSVVGTAIMIVGAAKVDSIFSTGTAIVLVGCAVTAWSLVRSRTLRPPPDFADGDRGGSDPRPDPTPWR